MGVVSCPPCATSIGAGAHLDESWAPLGKIPSSYDLSVYGPNAFHREYKGSVAGHDTATLFVRSKYEAECETGIVLDPSSQCTPAHEGTAGLAR